MFQNPLWSYVGMVFALLAIIAAVIFPEYSATLWAIASFFGFGSIAVLRDFIDSRGWKTKAIFFIVTALAALQMLNVITPEVFQGLVIAFAPITGITVQQALAKSTASVPKISEVK